jgi:hypothetical protein
MSYIALDISTQEFESLRNHFAACALSTLITEGSSAHFNFTDRHDDPEEVALKCERAYRYADAMLAERDRGRQAALKVRSAAMRDAIMKEHKTPNS